MQTGPMPRIGTAGWTIPRAVADAFPTQGSGLERYASVLNAAEINTTFYRSHKPDTYARWAGSVPDGFRFAVKAPKIVTHQHRLVDAAALMAGFLAEVAQLGDRLGPVLIQLPPTLKFDAAIAAPFLAHLRQHTDGPVALEPRHASWFEPDAEALLIEHRVARVAADPAKVPKAATPGGWPGLVYHRLHGSPRMYYSSYPDETLQGLSTALAEPGSAEAWCVFDNTASGAAAADALRLRTLLSR
jgi:uncharacterized protein YecE (DUF72 family)